MNVVHVFANADLDPPLKDFDLSKVVNVDSGVIFTRLPHGMTSGRSSVAIIVDLPDGRKVFAQLSMNNFEMVAAAFRGAEDRQHQQGN